MKPITELSNARKAKNLSLKQVFNDTKISIDILKAIEEGNFDYFSAKFYAKSFLKEYASYLGVPVDIVNILEDENNQISTTKNIRIVRPGITGSRPWLVFIGMAVIISLVLYGLLCPLGKKDGIKPIKYSVDYTAVKPVDTVIMVKGVTSKPTWVRVLTDNMLKEETMLEEGVTRLWKAKNSLKIRIGYTKGIDIFYRKSPDEEYRKIDIEEGSVGDVNEIEFLNDFIK